MTATERLRMREYFLLLERKSALFCTIATTVVKRTTFETEKRVKYVCVIFAFNLRFNSFVIVLFEISAVIYIF